MDSGAPTSIVIINNIGSGNTTNLTLRAADSGLAVVNRPTKDTVNPPTKDTAASVDPSAKDTAASVDPHTKDTAASVDPHTKDTAASVDPYTKDTAASVDPPTTVTTTSINSPILDTAASVDPPTKDTAASIDPPTTVTTTSINAPILDTAAFVDPPTTVTAASDIKATPSLTTAKKDTNSTTQTTAASSWDNAAALQSVRKLSRYLQFGCRLDTFNRWKTSCELYFKHLPHDYSRDMDKIRFSTWVMPEQVKSLWSAHCSSEKLVQPTWTDFTTVMHDALVVDFTTDMSATLETAPV